MYASVASQVISLPSRFASGEISSQRTGRSRNGVETRLRSPQRGRMRLWCTPRAWPVSRYYSWGIRGGGVHERWRRWVWKSRDGKAEADACLRNSEASRRDASVLRPADVAAFATLLGPRQGESEASVTLEAKERLAAVMSSALALVTFLGGYPDEQGELKFRPLARSEEHTS